MLVNIHWTLVTQLMISCVFIRIILSRIHIKLRLDYHRLYRCHTNKHPPHASWSTYQYQIEISDTRLKKYNNIYIYMRTVYITIWSARKPISLLWGLVHTHCRALWESAWNKSFQLMKWSKGKQKNKTRTPASQHLKEKKKKTLFSHLQRNGEFHWASGEMCRVCAWNSDGDKRISYTGTFSRIYNLIFM